MVKYYIGILTGLLLFLCGAVYANDRALWIWDKSDDIILHEQDRVEFYSFITAPHGDKNAQISTIFISISPDFLINNQQAVQRFIADAHSRGLSVQYLLGHKTYAMTAINPLTGVSYNQPLFDILDTSFFPYQIASSPKERFDALHLDIEPHTITLEAGLAKNAQPNQFWDWDNDSISLWSQYIDSLESIQSTVDTHNLAQTDSVQVGCDIPFWYDGLPNRNGDPSAGNQDVQNTVDFITVMNYEVRTDRVHEKCADEIAYGVAIGKANSVLVGFEAQEVSAKSRILYQDYGYLRGYNTIYLQTVSSWIFEEVENTLPLYGDTETLVNIIEANFDSPPDNDSSSFRGTAMHYYENVENGENAYRSIGLRDANNAPVCMLISPNGGELFSGVETIRYKAYDLDNDPIQIRVLSRLTDAQEWQLVSEASMQSSVQVDGTVAIDTMNPLLYAGTSLSPGDVVTTAQIRIEARELDNNGLVDNDGLNGFDVSDFSFSFLAEKQDTLAPIDNGVSIFSTPMGGYPVPGTFFISWTDAFVDSGSSASGIKGYWYSLYPPDQPDKAYFTHGFLGALPDVPAGLQNVYVWAEDYSGNQSAAVNTLIQIYDDTDGDGTADVIDGDIDGDGVSNTKELSDNTDTHNPLSYNESLTLGRWDFQADDNADLLLANSVSGSTSLRVTNDTADWDILPDSDYIGLNNTLWLNPAKYVTLDLADDSMIAQQVTALTVEMWIKPDVSLRSSSQFNFIPLFFIGDIDNGISLLLQNDARHLSLRFYHSGVSFIGSSGKFLSLNVLNEPLFEDTDNDGISDQWHHVAFSYNGVDRVVKLFVDGKLAGKLQGGQITSSIQSVNQTLRFFDARSVFDTDNYELAGSDITASGVLVNNSAQFESNYWEHIQYPSGRFIDNCKYGGLVNKIKITQAALPILQTYLLEDSDNDGMPDVWETENELNPYLNDANNDADNDGLINGAEYNHGSNLHAADTDNDGLSDGEEALIYFTIPTNPDTDNDGFLDGWEILNGYDPLYDDSLTDTDNDGLTDYYEINNNSNLYLPDTDNDGLTDSEELFYGTNPQLSDTDNDGFSDRQEISEFGTEFRINTYLPENQTVPSIVKGTNEYLIVWQSENQDGDGSGIYSILLKPDDSVQMPELLVNAVTAGDQLNPAAAADGNNYLIAWESFTQGIRSLTYQFVSSELQPAVSILGNEDSASLNNFPDGQLYYWGGYQASQDGESTGIWMKFANGAGATLHLGLYADTGNGYPAQKLAETQPVTLSAQFSGWQFFPFSAPVQVHAGQTYWFSWGHNHNAHVYVFYITDSLNPGYRDGAWNPADGYPAAALSDMGAHESRAALYLEYSFQDFSLNVINTGSIDFGIQDKELRPAVVHTGQDYVVVWQDNDGISGHIVENDGSVLMQPTQIMNINSAQQLNPSIASSGVDNLLIWKTNEGISGQRFTLSKDTDVLELGNSSGTNTNNFPAGFLFYWGNYQVSADGVSDGVWMKFYNGAGAAMHIALYEDSGNEYPAQKIAQTESVTIPNQVDGWFFFPFSEPITVAASKKYWIAWGHNHVSHVYPYYESNGAAYRDYDWNPVNGYPESALPNMGTHESIGTVYLNVVVSVYPNGDQIDIPTGNVENISAVYDGTAYSVSWEKIAGTQRIRCSQYLDSSGKLVGVPLPVATYPISLKNTVIVNTANSDALMVWQEKITDDTYDIIGAFAHLGLNTSPLYADIDGDGLNDFDELAVYFTNPSDNDTDNDGIADNWELVYGTGLTNPDSDNDGLRDGDELSWGTLILNPDTDNDGIPDGWEINHALNPFLIDTDNDGQTDKFEVIAGSDPLDKSSRFLMEVQENGLKWYCLPGKTYSVFVSENVSAESYQHGEPLIGLVEGDHEFIDNGLDIDNDGDIDESDFLPAADERVKSRMYMLHIKDDMF